MEQGVVVAGDLSLAWRGIGSGPSVLLLNGTGEGASSFGPLMESLASRFRCVAYDARDVGQSSRASDPYAPADLAEDATAIIEGLGLGPCHVVGFSLGGATAMELALARPELVTSLVLLSTWGRSDRWFRHQMANWKAIRRFHVDDENAFLRALNPWMFSPVTLEDDDALARIRRLWDESPTQEADAWCRQCDADARHDVLDRLGSIEQPTLVIVGEADLCTPPRYAFELAAPLPDARVSLIPDAGHCALFEDPDAVHGVIGSFLDQQATG